MAETVPLLDRPDRRLLLVGRGGGLTSTIGREALNLTGLEIRKNVLIVPSAAQTQEQYTKAVSEASVVFAGLGTAVSVLHAFGKEPSGEQIADELGKAHIVWGIGGDSSKAKDLYDRTGFGAALRDSRDTVISGGSAGMVLQAEKAMSWSTPVGKPEENAFIPVDGLGFVRATVSPHLDYIEAEDGLTLPRSYYFEQFLGDPQYTHHNPAIGVDDAAALAIHGDTYRVLHQDEADPSVGVTVFHRQQSAIHPVSFTSSASRDYAPIDDLLAA
jgi:peptidase E